MKIFTDLHHNDLYYALISLFEKRLGYEVYRPIGLDWFHNGYWKIAAPYNHAMDTVRQYLDIDQTDWVNAPWHEYKQANSNYFINDEVYHVHEPIHDYHQKAITFDQFNRKQN
jgi:hypothetical protein